MLVVRTRVERDGLTHAAGPLDRSSRVRQSLSECKLAWSPLPVLWIGFQALANGTGSWAVVVHGLAFARHQLLAV